MKNKKISKKTIIILTAVLVFSLVVGISVGKYLFQMTHPDINMLTNINN